MLLKSAHMFLCRNPLPHLFFTQEEFQQFEAALQAGMEVGWLRPVIGSQYPLEKVVQAHENIIHSSGATGKMILLIS